VKAASQIFIFLFIASIFAFSCAPHARKELSPAQAWAIDIEKATKATSILVAEFAAGELSLSAKQTKKFVKDYVAEREAVARRRAEASKSGERQDLMSEMRMNTEGFLRVMNDNLNRDQVKIATKILRPDGVLGGSLTGSLDGSVNRLVRGKVAKHKIEKAMPILVKYHQLFAALNARVHSEGISREDRIDNVIELRVATAKELASVIGAKAADFWLDMQRRKGISIKK
jgi:hypothetical protein